MKTILQVNSSGRIEDSITRKVAAQLAELLANDAAAINQRDLAAGLPFIDNAWIEANFTPEEERTTQHKQHLALSDSLVDEVKAADTLIVASPIYNFNVPAVLKAWIDLIARARLTFKYTENGPIGLLENKKAYIVVASGGVPLGTEYDFVTPYLKHVLGFMGITDVTLINANEIKLDQPMAKQLAQRI